MRGTMRLMFSLPSFSMSRARMRAASMLAIMFVAVSTSAAADPGLMSSADGAINVVVHVRSVRATDVRISSQPKATAMSIDARLEDLRSKFAHLRYRTFKMVGSKEALVPVKKKETLNLANGQTLTVRPLYIDKERVGMWLKWRDANGGEILDTRMHFESGQSMLTGLDGGGALGSESDGTVLAIDVRPAP